MGVTPAAPASLQFLYFTGAGLVLEGVGDAEADTADVGVAVVEGVGVDELPIAPTGSPIAVGLLGLGVGLAITTLTPLPHTSFFPDFMHLYLYPAYVFVEFNLVQVVPAFMAALAVEVKGKRRPIKISNESNRFIASQYCQRLTFI